MAARHLARLLQSIFCWACLLRHASEAQTVDLADKAVPGPKTISVSSLFFVYGSPDGGRAADVKEAPQVIAEGLTLTSPHGEQAQSRLQVGVLPLTYLEQVLAKSAFCGKAAGLNLTIQADAVHSEVSFGRAQNTSGALMATGVYALFMANCGDFDGLALSGTIGVRNPWGYLPATAYYKQHVYFGQVAGYVVIAAFWLFVRRRWRLQLFLFQRDLTTIVLVALVESAAWFALYASWNQHGSAHPVLLAVAQLLSVGKVYVAVAALFFLREVEQGSNVGEFEEAPLPWQKFAVLLAFILAEFDRISCMFYRNCQAFDLRTVLLHTAPSVALGVVLFVWLQASLSRAVDRRLAKQDMSAVSLLTNTRLLLALMAAVFAGLVGLQVFDPTMNGEPSLWRYHFVVSDAAPQGAFTATLLGCIVIWFPEEATQGYEYQAQAQQEMNVIGVPASALSDSDLNEEEEDLEGDGKSGTD